MSREYTLGSVTEAAKAKEQVDKLLAAIRECGEIEGDPNFDEATLAVTFDNMAHLYDVAQEIETER